MKKFKIAANVKPKVVRLDEAETDEPAVKAERARVIEEEPVLFDEDASPTTGRDTFEANGASLKRGGLMFLGGAKPQAISGASQVMEEMVAAAEAKKKQEVSTKSSTSGGLVFVTPKYEEALKLAGKTREVVDVDEALPERLFDEAVVKQDPVLLKTEARDLKLELETKIRDAQERYLLRKR